MNSLAVGIDIGGTKIAVGLVDSMGQILTSASFPTESRAGINNACERIANAIRELARDTKVSLDQVMGIGIGCPGPMNRETGEILNPHTLPGWEKGSLTECLSTLAQLPVHLENDADAALLGECFAGAGHQSQHVCMLTFGTGVGGAALCDGRVLRGVDGEHPEIGLMPVMYDQEIDYSGVPGSLEWLASGTGIATAGSKHGWPTCSQVFEAAQSDEPEAKRIIERAIRAATLAGLTLAHTLCPERIILGGGIMDSHYEPFAKSMQEAINQAVLLPSGKIQVVRAQLGNQAGLVGAASLVFTP